MAHPSRYKTLRSAYLQLLVADGGFRHTPGYQNCLANLRDWVAKESGLDPECVQDEFEALAEVMRKRLRK